MVWKLMPRDYFSKLKYVIWIVKQIYWEYIFWIIWMDISLLKGAFRVWFLLMGIYLDLLETSHDDISLSMWEGDSLTSNHRHLQVASLRVFFFFLQKIKNKTDFEREFWFASYLNSRLLSLDYSALCLDPHQCKPYALAARSSVPNPYDRDPMQVLLSQHHHIHHVEASYGQHIGAVLNCKQQHQQHKTQFVNIMNCDWFQTTVLP